MTPLLSFAAGVVVALLAVIARDVHRAHRLAEREMRAQRERLLGTMHALGEAQASRWRPRA